MSYDNERLGYAVRDLLQEKLPDALDTVEGLWSSVDPVSLPEPVTWFDGHDPSLVEKPSTEFPFVTVFVPNREPEPGTGAVWGIQDQLIEAWVGFVVGAVDAATVNKCTHRYAEAIVTVLQDNRVIEGFRQVNYEPGVELGQAMRHPSGGVSGDSFRTSETDFLQAGTVEVVFEGD